MKQVFMKYRTFSPDVKVLPQTDDWPALVCGFFVQDVIRINGDRMINDPEQWQIIV